jgi:LEA14-like dessication related protein
MTDAGGWRRRAGVAIAVLVAICLLLAGATSALVVTGVVEVEQPTVTSMNTTWGTVTDETTEIETRVTVHNPNPIDVPGVLDVRYRATMNDVVLASGTDSGVGIQRGNSTIELNATMRNDKVPQWWVSHVNAGERSTLAIDGRITGPFGLRRSLNRTETIETDLLSGLVDDERRAISINDRELLVLSNQSARWGNATENRTPVIFSSTVRNRHDYPIALDGVRYVVEMNGVTVGDGVTAAGIRVAPNETRRIQVRAGLDTPMLAEWWEGHLRNDERSTLTVATYGVVDRDGERTRLPVALMDVGVRFETDLLGGDATSTTPIEGEPAEGLTYERPRVENVDREWGSVTDETTEIRSSVTVVNPNSGPVADLLRLSVGETVTIEGVTVADDRTAVGTLDPGPNDVSHVVRMDNAAVPRWWARHVNSGERSTVVASPTATADVGFTKFDVRLQSRESTFETDLLGGLGSTNPQPLTIEGQEVGTVLETRAEWGEATVERTPVEVSVRVENTAPVPITISDLGYDVRMNDVVVGNGTSSGSVQVPAGATRTLTYTLVLDSQSMDEWWVTHVRNGERTVVSYDAAVTVSVRDRSERVPVAALSTNQTVETDVLEASGAHTARFVAGPSLQVGAWIVGPVGSIERTDRTDR